jgi:hypothetical protein
MSEKTLKDGVTYTENINVKQPPRADTGDKTQQPKATTKRVTGDDGRGSFKSKE